MIRATDLRFRYGDSFQLNGITFHAAAGDFLGIIGPNGSGKSTLLKVISKVLAPDSGTVEIAGRPLQALPLRELARQMAVVGSDALFAFPFLVRDVVLMGRVPFLGRFSSPSPHDHRKVEAALHKTEAWQFRDRYIDELSSGERQRVMLARALAQEPRILLLDEPTAHLDLHFEIEIFRILKALNETERLTVVAVSHNLNLMAEFCGRIMILRDGLCHSIGTPREVFTPDLLQEVFRIGCRVDSNPFSNAPTITLDTGFTTKQQRE